MPHSIFDCLYLLLGTSRLAVVQSLGLIIILTLYDPMLFLCLSNIKIRHMKSILHIYIGFLSVFDELRRFCPRLSYHL